MSISLALLSKRANENVHCKILLRSKTSTLMLNKVIYNYVQFMIGLRETPTLFSEVLLGAVHHNFASKIQRCSAIEFI